MAEIHYSFDKKESFIDQKTGIEIFKIFNLKNNINNNIIFLKGQYFGIKYDMQYAHLLMDGIGVFLYLKQQYKDLKLIVFKYNNKYNQVCEDFINFFNADIINIKENSYCIEQLIFAYTEDLRITGIKEKNDNSENIFISPIPSNLFLNEYYDINEQDPRWLSYRKESIKALCNKFFPYRKEIETNKIYVNRNTGDSRIDVYSKTNWFNKIRYIDQSYYEKIEYIMKNNNYEIIIFDNLGFFDQINLAYNASEYITIDGSSILNSIWCKENTKITRIMINKEYKKLNYDWNSIILASGNKNINVIDLTELKSFEITKNILYP